MSSSQTPSTATRRHGSALRVAFPLTVPILAGFLLTSATCGIYASSLGLPWWAPTFMAVAIFAGSAEFIVASMLVEPFNPLATSVTILAVNARHLFYGLSMLDKYAHVKRRPYPIYAMCDETFSVIFSAECPEDVNESDFHFWISFLNQAYRVIGCTLGGIFGSARAVSIPGISFALTALFVVIFLDQWLKDASHVSSVIGFVAGVIALLAFGPSNFMVSALVVYCLKDVNPLVGSHGAPETIAVALVVATYLWRRNMLVSIFAGTAFYMVLVNLVFV